jgi:ketosteroid isomerase-like protein
MRRLVLLAAVLAASAGILAWWFSPGQIVKRRTRNVLDLLTLDAGTPATNRMLGTFSLGRLLDDPVALDLPSAGEANGSFSRQDLEAGYQWLCRNVKESRVRVIRFDPVATTNGSAVVHAELDARVDLQDSRPFDGPSDATFEWRKRDDGWRLARVSWRGR